MGLTSLFAVLILTGVALIVFVAVRVAVAGVRVDQPSAAEAEGRAAREDT